MRINPKFRCTTGKSIDKLSKLLRVSNEPYMQDWEWEIADHTRLNEYITLYQKGHMTDDDRIAIMEIIIQCIDDLYSAHGFAPRQWNRVKSLIAKNRDIHQYTVFYWSYLEEFTPRYYAWHISKIMSCLYLKLYAK